MQRLMSCTTYHLGDVVDEDNKVEEAVFVPIDKENKHNETCLLL